MNVKDLVNASGVSQSGNASSPTVRYHPTALLTDHPEKIHPLEYRVILVAMGDAFKKLSPVFFRLLSVE